MIGFVEKTLRHASNALILVASLCLVLMMVHVLADVALKYAINAPIPGTAEVVAHYYMVAVVFLPLPLVELKNKAIFVDIIYNFMSLPVKRAVIAFAYCAQATFFCVLAWQSSIDAIEALQKGGFVEGIVNIVIWPGRFFLPLGFALAAAVSFLRVVQIITSPDWQKNTSLSGTDDELASVVVT